MVKDERTSAIVVTFHPHSEYKPNPHETMAKCVSVHQYLIVLI
jgi:hypothetical protein